MAVRFLRPLSACLLALGLAACSSLAPRDPLRIDLAGLEPLPSQDLEARFAVKLRVQNPNDSAIDYNGVSLELDVNGRPLASGVSDQQGEIPRFGERVLSVPVTVSAFSAVRQAWGLAEQPPRRNLPYSLRGKLAGGLLGTVRFSESGTLQWPDATPVP
ncbi:LEA type 2 family protein [Pseudomonas mangiferae]|uniref:Water stress/hypersensitive response domain-containing protein n=1 Tax=Pseudomonas mangiferae TaxID=2593654 RepID=A0A553H2V5_9PSED|nr:LEA type 2 family protein [Pseudomonas mangiferae]TRX76077.1 water stress/hypersensitive response domain-containing protein [Pseudomonas mangiferae]